MQGSRETAGVGAGAGAESEEVFVLPASFAQERMWFLDQLFGESAAYNMPVALRLCGTLDHRALTGALAEIVRRHEVLRTTFPTLRGELAQVVRPASRAGWPLVDLSRLPEEVRGREEGRIRKEEARRRFDLVRGPLLRTLLVRLGAEEHVALCVMHHIVSDGWSRGVLSRELGLGYAAAREGRASPLPPLSLQYADYAAWQREWLGSAGYRRQLGYWTEKLAEAPAALDLFTDHPRRAVPGHRGARCGLRLPRELVERLRELSRREGVTMMMTLLAGWKVLLARYSGETDLVVGTPIAGRNRRELEELVGLFVNTLALRTDLSGEPGFVEVLRRVCQTMVAAHAHQEVPFERVVEAVRPGGDPARNPLFEVMFSYVAAPRDEMRLPGLTLSLLDSGTGAAQFDLELHLVESPDGLSAWLGYRAELYEAETAERMLGHFARILEAAVEAPGVPFSRLALLPPEEERRVVLDFNRTDAGLAGDDASVPRLFEAQAARTPDAAAVVCGEEVLSYAELDARANRLAHHLRGLGVGPEVRVGVCLARTPELPAAVLGVLKAGGAYVPLDPAHPPERLALVLRDAGAAVLLTEEGRAERLLETGAVVVRVDADREAIRRESPEAPVLQVAPEGLAYVIYTSGSTGTPKGVLVEHRGLANLLLGAREVFGLGPGEVAPALASCAFDIWAFEVFSPLLAGGTVRLLSAQEVMDPRVLARESAEATMLHAVPALMRQLAEVAREEGAARGVRRVFTGGDTVPPELLAELRAAFPAAEVRVLYGPTEGTVLASSFRVPEQGTVEGHPIGGPLPNVRLYLCDRTGSPVPLGVPGELCIGGAGVARGYLGRAALTAEKWVPDPFAGEPGARMYRTGDRARRRTDGVLEFLGRTDQQVKVRGFRIEPGEVEARLVATGGVREAVVLVREDVPGDRRLVAYVVADEEPDPAELRARLRAVLPEYMVPSTFVRLGALPLNRNGKVDRAQLPAPVEDPAGREHASPRDPLEELVAGAWCEALGMERVGVHDDLFERGGNSLLVMRVATRLRAALGVEIPIRVFFSHGTVAALAGWIREARGGEEAEYAPIPRADRSRPLPLSFAQERLWFLEQAEETGAGYMMPFGLRLEGEGLDSGALERSFTRVIERHEVLRTVFRAVEGEGRQCILPPEPFVLPLADLTEARAGTREAELARLAALQTAHPFDLEKGPLLRALLVRLGRAEHVLLVNLHHIVFDGWSGGLMVRELAACYEAFRAGREPSLPELAVQYADYAAWEREWLRSRSAQEQVLYWKRQLAGLPALDLSGGRPRPGKPSYRGGRIPVRIGPDLAARVRARAREAQATPFMLLLAVFKVVLAHHGRTRDLAVGVDVAGRRRVEVEPLVGFFINELVLRTDLSGDPSFTELLRRVRTTTLDAYQSQDLPFALLVKELAGRRSIGTNPLFQVMFGLDNTPRPTPALQELRTTPVALGTEVSVFELCLYLTDTPREITGSLRYRTDLFDAQAAESMRSDFLALLEGVCEHPGRRVETLLAELAERERARRAELARAAGEAGRVRFQGIRRKAIPITPTPKQETA